MNDVSICSGFLVSEKDIEKVVPNEMNMFKQKAEEVLLLIKLQQTGSWKFNMKDVFEYCARDDLEGSRLYNYLDADVWDLLEDRLSESYNLLSDVFHAFKEKTGIGLNIEMNYETDEPYFYLVENDVVELTPQAKKLQEIGIRIEMEKWTEQY